MQDQLLKQLSEAQTELENAAKVVASCEKALERATAQKTTAASENASLEAAYALLPTDEAWLALEAGRSVYRRAETDVSLAERRLADARAALLPAEAKARDAQLAVYVAELEPSFSVESARQVVEAAIAEVRLFEEVEARWARNEERRAAILAFCKRTGARVPEGLEPQPFVEKNINAQGGGVVHNGLNAALFRASAEVEDLALSSIVAAFGGRFLAFNAQGHVGHQPASSSEVHRFVFKSRQKSSTSTNLYELARALLPQDVTARQAQEPGVFSRIVARAGAALRPRAAVGVTK
jgi:hypothetical protein